MSVALFALGVASVVNMYVLFKSCAGMPTGGKVGVMIFLALVAGISFENSLF